MAHTDSFRKKIDIADMHRLTAMILDISNEFHNKNVTINERVCVIPPTYYLDWFGKYYQNVPLNKYDGPFCIQCMYGIQGVNQPDDNGFDSLMKWIQF